MSATVYIGDNLSIIKSQLKDESVDLIYLNPPFGTTQQSWDERLNWPKLFEEFFRILKPDGVIAIHCSVPFNYLLIREAPKPPTYSWYWLKDNVTNPLLAKHQPLRNTEEILIWTNRRNRYYPQRNGTEKRIVKGGYKKTTNSYYGTSGETVKKEVVGRLQTHHIEMPRLINGFSTRPSELIELIINSYTQPGDTILDPTCYKGFCGAIAKNMGRKYIGIDKHFMPEKLM